MAKFCSNIILCAVLLYSCGNAIENSRKPPSPAMHLVRDVDLYNSAGELQAVIEIPAGTNEKWEVNKKTGKIERDSINGFPRTIDYLGYPANYGFVPQTLLSKESGGDGDPLDAIILGKVNPRGTVVSCKVIGILRLTDQGEQDDKLILVDLKSSIAKVETLEELETLYPNVLTIIRDWFLNYKGPGKMISQGYANKNQAETIIKNTHNQFVKGSVK